MEKVKLVSAGKHSLRSKFSFDKSWEVVDALDEIVGRLGLNETPNHSLKDLIYSGKEPGPKFKIEKIEDEIYNMRNGNYFVDIFIGKSKIFLIVNSITGKQKEISEAVFEFADFKKGDLRK